MSQTKVEIIAEVAQGFEGKIDQAKLLAKGAIAAKADAVKFQLVYADELATPDYQYYSLFKNLELKDQDWIDLVGIVKKENLNFYFDVFGPRSLELAKKTGADGVKISTTEFYNETLISNALKNFKKVYISIGGIPIEDIQQLIDREQIKPHAQVTFMYGFQSEPTPLEENNLSRLESLRRRFEGHEFGFMDHSLGGEAEEGLLLPIMALSTGISAIEKHITLDYELQIEDYISALSPTRFSELVRLIRKMEVSLGSPKLVLTDREREYANKATKVVVATNDLSANTVLKLSDLTLKRVGSSDSSKMTFKRLNEVIGKTVKQPISKDQAVSQDSIL